MEIKQDSLVKINYKGTLSDGTVFDTNEGKEPLEFIVGIGMVIPGLETGILGMKIGDKKTVNIKSDEAYGPVMPEAIQNVPKEQFPTDIKLEVGMQLAAQGPQGVIPVMIKEIQDKIVVVDFNHPLAGKDLTFDVEILDVKDSTDEDKQRILGPMMNQGGCSGNCHDGSCADGNCGSHKHEVEESLEDSLDEEDKKEE